jgi:hypothetical protein
MSEPKEPHPYDGKIVRRRMRDKLNEGYWLYGLVELVTEDTFSKLGGRWYTLTLGESVVRFLTKSGKPGKKWERIFSSPALMAHPSYWQVHEGSVFADQ